MKSLVSIVTALVVSLTLASVPSRAEALAGWRLVVNDQFTAGGIPTHWRQYDGPYQSGPKNCATPALADRSPRGYLRLRLQYLKTGKCGAGWYSAGLKLAKEYASVNQRISLRFRVGTSGGVRGHRNLPMRWPSSGNAPDDGEENFCEGSSLVYCRTWLHYKGGRIHYDYRVNLGQWHTMTFERSGYTIRSYIDGRLRWTYRGSRKTLPPTLMRPVLQLECRTSACPTGTTGREIVYIDWIKVWNPA